MWIWKPGPVRTNDYALFRRSFHWEGGAARAELRVSAHHFLLLEVNGRRISGYGSPAPTTPPRTKYELRYDISALLVPGLNTVSAVVHYLGGGGQNSVDGYPGFRCELDAEDPRGRNLRLVSDESWEVCGESPYAAGRPYQQSRRLSVSERYDGRIARRTTAWMRGERDDLTAGYAVPSLIESAEEPWVLVPQAIPEGREECAIRPERCGIQRVGHQTFDAGRIVSGWVRLTLRGVGGAEIRVRYSERLEADGSVARSVCNERSATYCDEYAMGGDPDGKEETWQPDFAYKAFRYFEITGYPGWIGEEDAEVVWAHTPLGDEGGFECSDPLLNALFDACIRTQKNNVLGLVTDCPHREQAQYLADSDLQSETLTAFFAGARPVLRKVLEDFRDAMQPDGTFPFVAPGSTDRPEFDFRIPEWDLHFVSLLWNVYFAYSDLDIVQRCYGAASRMIDALLGRVSGETGLLPKSGYWHISDWPYPSVDQEGPYLTVYNAKFHRALELMSKLARLDGKAEDVGRYEEAANALKSAMLRHLYDPAAKAWGDCWGSESRSQGTNALAARSGLTPEEDLPEAIMGLTQEWSSRTVLSLELFRVLFEHGEGATAMAWLTRPDYPGWGYMIAQGAKTMWEGFEDIESHSHAWNGYPARLMADYLLGVQALEPAYARVRISPNFAPVLTYAKGTIKTVQGDIRVRWERMHKGIAFYVELPPGVTAEVVVAEVTTVVLPPGVAMEATSIEEEAEEVANPDDLADEAAAKTLILGEGSHYRFLTNGGYAR
ncbi:hypothetical protein A9X05_12240 [Mycobacterium sp. E3298]|uniref:alpha-L-rhamnosidase n=1 Tax=Mycobacterium sp. E3298 TaxID=1856865 RepID=UPI0007FCC9D5|nr:alpha-L-rhamnosidase [Mycobacterium sp. E3298]OBG90383.1 hypothetical protein A9X05_12240 [Mycobacterium sp. E3298]